MVKPIIIGYDPGLTTAFAALDLKGNLLTTKGQREWASPAVAQAIREAGQPLIIAVDKEQASDSAEKFAARFGCKLWSPDSDLKVEDKNLAVKDLLKTLEQAPDLSVHEKDALAAAIFAYKAFAGQFSKIDDTLAQAGMGAYADEAKRMIVAGEAKNISEALDRIREKDELKKEELKSEPKVEKPQTSVSKTEAALQSKVRDLERSLDIQKLYIEKMEGRLKDFQRANERLQEEQLKKSDSARREVWENKELSLREGMISNLHAEIDGLRKANDRLAAEIRKRDERAAILEEGAVALVPVSEWSREALSEADRGYGAKDAILWVRKFSEANTAVKFCIALHPKVAVMDCDETTERLLRNADIAVIKTAAPTMREFYGSLGREELESRLKGSERAGFLNWLKGYQERI